MKKFIIILLLILNTTDFLYAEKYEITLEGKKEIVEATQAQLTQIKKKAWAIFIKEILIRGLAKKNAKGIELIEDADLSFYDFTVADGRGKEVTKNCDDFIREIK